MKREKFTRVLLPLVLAVCLLVVSAAPAKAASSDEIQQEIDSLEERKSDLQKELEALEAMLSQNLDETVRIVEQKQILDRQVFLLNESLENTELRIQVCASRIADRQEQLSQAQDHLAELNRLYKERIRAMEESGEMSYWSVLFGAKSFADFLDRLSIVEEIAAADQRRLREISEAADAVADAQRELLEEMSALEAVRLEQQESREIMAEKQKEADAMLQTLLERGEEYQTLLEQGEEAQRELMEQIAEKKEEFDQAAYQEWLNAQKPPENPAGNGEWLTPVPYYRLTSRFGMRLHPILGVYRMHNGIDMACDEGTPIYASRSGQVSIAEENASAGFYVQINHGDGFRSVYMHMTHFIVEVGEYVMQGQVIGYVGNTGMSKGSHLHFGISYNGEYVNPLEYIDLPKEN